MNQKTRELNRRNNELDELLIEKDQKLMTDLVCYLRSGALSAYDQEAVRGDLLEMALSARQRGESMEELLGGDPKAFCDEVIASLPPRSRKEKVLETASTVLYCLSILLTSQLLLSRETFDLLKSLFTGGSPNFNVSISTGTAVIWALILLSAFFIVNRICKTSLAPETEQEGKGKRFLKGGLLGGGAALLLIGALLLGKNTLFTINLFVGFGVCLAFFLAHFIMERYTNE